MINTFNVSANDFVKYLNASNDHTDYIYRLV